MTDQEINERIWRLERDIESYEELDESTRSRIGQAAYTKYLAAKEELEHLESLLNPEPENTNLPDSTDYPRTTYTDYGKKLLAVKNFYAENKTVVNVVAAGVGVLFLRKLLK